VLHAPPGDGEDTLLRFDPCPTDKRLLTSQTFRSLFRSEVVGGAEGLAIRDVALLFTDIKGSTAPYQRVSDLNAFQLVQRHFDWLREATVRHGGAVVRTLGDAVMAAYPGAARSARRSRCGARSGEPTGASPSGVSLKSGVHHGAAIAVTPNKRLDHFGQTVNIASGVRPVVEAGEIRAAEEVWCYPGARKLLAPYPAEWRTMELR
jgi:class 3 adenylate cyclase